MDGAAETEVTVRAAGQGHVRPFSQVTLTAGHFYKLIFKL